MLKRDSCLRPSHGDLNDMDVSFIHENLNHGHDTRTLFTVLTKARLLALLGVAGCSPPWLEPPFETAYSSAGAQVK
jgi:hypothetical protein